MFRKSQIDISHPSPPLINKYRPGILIEFRLAKCHFKNTCIDLYDYHHPIPKYLDNIFQESIITNIYLGFLKSIINDLCKYQSNGPLHQGVG